MVAADVNQKKTNTTVRALAQKGLTYFAKLLIIYIMWGSATRADIRRETQTDIRRKRK